MASNMYYSNNITQSPATNIPTSENYGNDNFYTQNYESGTNNYSSNIYTGETPQYYDQYYPDNNKNMLYKMKLKPKYNTNSINVNAYLRENKLYGKDNVKELMNYNFIGMTSKHPTKPKNNYNYYANNIPTAKNITDKTANIFDAIINNNGNKNENIAPNVLSNSQFLNNIQQKENIQVQEIISKNESVEYSMENQSGVIVDYAYCEAPNSEYRDYMEDRGKAIENLNNDPNKALFCIFDGHGGKEVSQYLQDNFHIYLKQMLPFKRPFEDITNLFRLLDEKIKLLNVPEVGSTATIVYIEKINNKRILYCANVGDSRCVLVNRKGIMRMSHEDRVDDKKEYERVIRQGGVIFNERIYGTLMLTRSFGDWGVKKYGVVVEPHIIKIELNEDDLYLLIASDGLWDVIKDEECKGFTEIYDKTFDTCKNLVKECLNRGSTDNISCFVLQLN